MPSHKTKKIFKKFPKKIPKIPKKDLVIRSVDERLIVQVKLLKDIVKSIVGIDAVGIVDLLSGRKNVNEFAIAERLKITINQTRNILYKLSDEGLVSFVRKKDKKNVGWYTYFWTLEINRSLANLKKMLEGRIKSLQEGLGTRKKARFYYCGNCDIEYGEEDAMHAFFACAECGEVLELKDNQELIKNFEDEISKLKNDLVIVNEELEKVVKKEDASVMRKIKVLDKKKKLEREIRRKKRAAEKKRELEKLGIKGKKVVKKKVSKKKAGKKKIKKVGKKKVVRKVAKKVSNKSGKKIVKKKAKKLNKISRIFKKRKK